MHLTPGGDLKNESFRCRPRRDASLERLEVAERLAPRPFVPVAHLAPLISYSLRWLRQGGISVVTICANGTLIEDAFGDGDDMGWS